MKFVGYIITRSLIWLLHLLPEFLLYFFSDIFYLLTYRLVGYRKKVVMDNLSRAFPDLGHKAIKRTARGFYHHLCDLILESAIAHFYSSKKALDKISYRNPELLDKFFLQGKQVLAVTAHYGNWEYLSTLPMVCKYPVSAIYKPLKNKYFDRMTRHNREKFGVEVVAMEKVARKLIAHHRDGEPVLTIFLSDQRPMLHTVQYWTKFLGQDTPLFLGTEKLAHKLDAAVVFLKIRKLRRGRYEVEVVPVCDDPKGMKPFEITERHVRILEDLIREAPDYWLWSHRRWKHSRERSIQPQEKKQE
jgi:KDO2-lipid IV(A) lauroyltransferase